MTDFADQVDALAQVILAERINARELPDAYLSNDRLLAAMRPRAEAILTSEWFAEQIAAAKAEVDNGAPRIAEPDVVTRTSQRVTLLDRLTFRAARQRRAERRMHNDRDYACRYWWGDRGGYSLRSERCSICNPADGTDHG